MKLSETIFLIYQNTNTTTYISKSYEGFRGCSKGATTYGTKV
jgi:hypothetical protein